MAIFGIRINKDNYSEMFIKDTERRLEKNDFVKNPFTGYIKTFEDGRELITVLNMSPLWPNFGPWVALIFLLPVVFFQNLNLMVFPLIFLFISFFWTTEFFYFIFKVGLRKKGYVGSIKRIKNDVLIDELIRRF